VCDPLCRYDQEEGGGVDETHEPFVGDDALFEKRAAEMQKKLTRRDGSMMTLAQSKRASELQRDITAWEENRLFRSGVVSLREVRHPPQHRLIHDVLICDMQLMHAGILDFTR
jgi:hypothetical protein